MRCQLASIFVARLPKFNVPPRVTQIHEADHVSRQIQIEKIHGSQLLKKVTFLKNYTPSRLASPVDTSNGFYDCSGHHGCSRASAPLPAASATRRAHGDRGAWVDTKNFYIHARQELMPADSYGESDWRDALRCVCARSGS